ncbi:MAG TPA: T9SS type A sorting domain-containing protein [Chitinophagales bacterium]|nr:T9SS type A sorting domain-containing protein [Chitinophagales bacterium]
MKKFLFSFPALCISVLSFAQYPLVKQWDYRFGGNGQDQLYTLIQTNDGGYLLGGSCRSDSTFDVSQPNRGGSDFWIVKTDGDGMKQWDRRYGGSGDEVILATLKNSDGGYLLVGSSTSGIGGEKTEPNWDLSNYTYDYWVVRIDSLSNILWDHRYGGTSNDYAYTAYQATNGAYLIVGTSQSDSNGDKTEPSWGDWDCWIIKIDSGGNKLWDKRYGGTLFDAAYDVAACSDGGCLIGGMSASGVSGDKTEPSWGGTDYWIVKIDSQGSKQWDKRYGGTGNENLRATTLTYDNGFILGGWSDSDSSGDKTNFNWGGLDFWIVMIDSEGNKIWDRNYGGTNHEDELKSIVRTSGNHYMIAGTSYSVASGDKTENNLGQEQTWVLNIAANGDKVWDETLQTDCNLTDDEIGVAIQSGDGCYVMANYTVAGVGGDKTQPNWPYADYWMIKFCDTTLATTQQNLSNSSYAMISPNPFSGSATLLLHDAPGKNSCFYLYDIYGKKRMQLVIQNPETKIQQAGLTSGIYFYEIREMRYITASGKIIIE